MSRLASCNGVRIARSTNLPGPAPGGPVDRSQIGAKARAGRRDDGDLHGGDGKLDVLAPVDREPFEYFDFRLNSDRNQTHAFSARSARFFRSTACAQLPADTRRAPSALIFGEINYRKKFCA
jgi:hypothetical protein